MNVTTDLDARFRAAAVAEGIVDVRYDVVASPVGDLHVAATGRGLLEPYHVRKATAKPGDAAAFTLRL